MPSPLLLAAAAVLALAGCSTGTAERAARAGVGHAAIGAALGAVAGAFDGHAGRSAAYGAAVGATAGVVTTVVNEVIYDHRPYRRHGNGYHDDEYGDYDDDYGNDGYDDYGGNYDWGPYPYDPARAEEVLAADEHSPDAIGRPVAYPYGGTPDGAAGPAGVIVAEASPHPRDVAGYLYKPR